MKAPDTQLRAYYKTRAPVYDRVYDYPERQTDLAVLKTCVADQFTDRHVIEVAAGTGYWTEQIGRHAKSVLATDITQEALDQIAHRDIHCPLTVRVADAYALEGIGKQFTGAFAGLWFSHVPIQKRAEWLSHLHEQLTTGAAVVLLDNSVRQCERLPLSDTDVHGNTYQIRVTDSGEQFRVLKNFPTQEPLVELIETLAHTPAYRALDHYWTFQYTAR